MSYKIIALMLVLLIAGAMTATAYEFSVNYDENIQLKSATFPGSKEPITPVTMKEQNLPDAQLIKTVSLGEIICSSEAKTLAPTAQAVCKRHISCHDYPCTCPCGESSYNGNGKFLGEVDSKTGKRAKLGAPVPLGNDNVSGVKKVSPLGELMIFKTSDNKIIRCIVLGSQIIMAPPSNE